MRERSEDEHTLIRIQHEWAEARVKGDSSYAGRVEANDCTIVWPDGSIVNKQQDLQTMTGDIVFTEFKIDDLLGTLVWRHWNRLGPGNNQGAEGKSRSSRRKIRVDRHICEAERSMESDRFPNHSGLGKIVTHSYRLLL